MSSTTEKQLDTALEIALKERPISSNGFFQRQNSQDEMPSIFGRVQTIRGGLLPIPIPIPTLGFLKHLAKSRKRTY